MRRKVALSDVQPSRRTGGETRALLTPESVGAISGFLGVITLRPGEYQSALYHPFSDKFLFVSRGSLVVVVDGEEHLVQELDALFVQRGATHRIENRGDTVALAVYQIAPLAPSPELGHVDVEEPPHPAVRPPSVGG